MRSGSNEGGRERPWSRRFELLPDLVESAAEILSREKLGAAMFERDATPPRNAEKPGRKPPGR